MRVYWTFEHDGENQDLDLASQEAAEQAADDYWADKFSDESLPNGTVREDSCELIAYSVNAAGDEFELARKKHNLCFEAYHGDFAEHNTHWGLR